MRVEVRRVCGKIEIAIISNKLLVVNGGKGSGVKGHITTQEEKIKEVKTFLGKEFKGYKGENAIRVLIKEKQGYVKGAFTRKDIGDIDLVWGDERKGLAHIIKRRIETNQNFKSLLDELTDTIEKGEIEESRNALKINYKGKTAIIEPNFKNLKIQLVITAYYDYDKIC